MNSLIAIEARNIGHAEVQTVNARDLHAFLEVGKVFAAWIQERIAQYGFVEHHDYVMTVSKTGIRQNVIQKDYHLSLDMAKELAMVERNEKGKEARRYFIECERRAKSMLLALPDFTDPVAAARAWAAEAEAKRTAQLQLEAAAPKLEYADALLNADGTTKVADVAKTIGVRVRKLQSALKKKGVILSNNAPAASYVAKGYFLESTHPYETKTRGVQIGHTARVTGKGIEFLRRFAARHADLLGASQ